MHKVVVEHQEVVKKLEYEKRVFQATQRSAIFSLKDHKENLQNDPKVRLLNPTKNEIRKMLKQILENVISVIRKKSKLNSLKNTGHDWSFPHYQQDQRN